MRAVLTYHSLDRSGSPVSIEPDVFEEHVDWLASGQVEVTDLPQLLELPSGTDAVAVTFDDGFRNFATEAWPLLRERRLPVTLFVVSGHAGGVNDWGTREERRHVPELPLLDWRELGELADEGVALGSHTVTHPDLSQLEVEAVEEEVVGSADRIEAETGHRPRCFAYPYGRAGTAAGRCVREHYRVACTTAHRALGDGDPPHLVPRLEARYFSRRRLERWGRASFRGRVRARSGFRRIRRALTGGRR